MLNAFILAGSAYLVGAIPVGYCIARMCGIANITEQGSGNIGATNVGRILGARFFILVFFLDALKAWSVVVWAQKAGYSTEFVSVVAALVLFGNGCSLFLHGKGGKGVATAAGIYAAVQPQLFFVFGLLWGASLFVAKTAGIASLIVMLVMPFVTYSSVPSFTLLSCGMSLWVIYRHRDNIRTVLTRK